jgi:hypothetical protein
MYNPMVSLTYLSPPALELGISLGLAAWLFSAHLTQPGEVFGWLPGLVSRFTSKQWVHKPLYACAKCVGGQWAFWAALALGLGWQAVPAAVAAMLAAVAADRWVG